ncbi:MAG: adenylate/guanylate cyclase domain-containing protein [Bacteroidota bacterium]
MAIVRPFPLFVAESNPMGKLNQQLFARAFERGLLGAAIGLAFAWFETIQDWKWFLVWGIIGFLIGGLTRLLDYILYQSRLRRRRFIVVWIARTLSYALVVALSIFLVISVYTLLDSSTETSDIIRFGAVSEWLSGKGAWRSISYSVLSLLGLQFLVLMVRLVGPNVIINYMIGRYRQPVEEERIFMFMDLRSSTTIAETIGHYQWHGFLNDFFFDIARPVRRSKGEIYQYVGDEVVISWPKQLGAKKLNCINCFFTILKLMEKRREHYLENYGFEPVFKAGYHVGKVITGEIGDYKREIVFHGDVVNTASRIQVECNTYNRRLLLSANLLQLLNIEGYYTKEYINKIFLRGKQEEIELYSLDPVEE